MVTGEGETLNLALNHTRTYGRAVKETHFDIVRELTAADTALLAEERGIKPTQIKRLRDAHHHIARLVAEGLTNSEIREATGYTVSRISILKSDPAFAQLTSFYRQNLEQIRDEVYADSHRLTAAVRHVSLELILDRFEETPELISNDFALDTFKATADRSGQGPQTKSTSVSVNIDYAGRAAAGRLRASRPSVVDSTPMPALESTTGPGQTAGESDRDGGGSDAGS